MRRLIACIGCGFILIGIAGVIFLFTGLAPLWFGYAAVGQFFFLLAGALLALVVVGVLMVIGETDARGR